VSAPLDRRGEHAIIGAGFCGLGVAAAFKRHGIPIRVFERSDAVGGNWYHGVYESAHIISSRKTTEYADFPMPASYPDFPSGKQMLAYLRAYAEHHRLGEHVELGAEVTRVAPAADGVSWDVELANGEAAVYGGVVVCNGHHWDRRMPSYPGAFTGEMMHSKDYKRPEILAGKRVLVIGGGNSACDVAVEASRHAASAHISMRRGYWFLPKTMLGVPMVEMLRPWMPVSVQRAAVKALVRVIVGRYEDYGLMRPDHKLFDKHPTINSELLYGIRHGRITPHPDVQRFDGEHVAFVDGARERFDLVVAATGYDVSFPFLAEGVLPFVNGLPELYGGVATRTRKNIYFFGVGQPRYGAGPLITAGADVLCSMVDAQKKLAHPLGAVLERLGERPPRSALMDPFEVLRKAKLAKRLIPRLAVLEPLLMR
jgi:Flavin-binding monooxygenase-like